MWGKKRTPPPPEWVCPHCGGTHTGLPTDYGWRLPDEVWALGEEARQAHLDWWTEACCHEGRWFLRGVLYVPFTFSDGRWGWGCWAEVSESTARTLWELKDADGSHLPRNPAPWPARSRATRIPWGCRSGCSSGRATSAPSSIAPKSNPTRWPPTSATGLTRPSTTPSWTR